MSSRPEPVTDGPLDAPLRGAVGARTAKVLSEQLGLATVGDLLHHYPRRYAERGELTPLGGLETGEHVTVLAEIAKVSGRRITGSGGRRPGHLLRVEVTDGRGRLSLAFFNSPWRAEELRPGRRGLFAGKVGRFRDEVQLTQPDYQLLDESEGDDAAREFAGRLIPVYPACRELPSWKIARAVALLLDSFGASDFAGVVDPLPAPLRERHRLLPLPEALEQVHRPVDGAALQAARRRLKWDEALVLQVALAQRRADADARRARPRRPAPDGVLAALDAALPFSLTAGQRRVGAEIEADLARESPMHRLLQGEVGSGKTLVALRAMLTVVDAGGQAVLLAPTEVLAQQHARSLRELLGPLADRVGLALLTGALGTAARRRALLDLVSGDAGLVVGTHALLQEHVAFHDLGLVVVDEQHRFGVDQRAALGAKSELDPHLLVMTATPIPRTVAMTVFGDLDTSRLDELPAGRSEIATHLVPSADKPHFLQRAWERLREEVAAGHQAYVVCPRIGDEDGAGPSESDQAGAPSDGPDGPDGPDGGADGSDAAPAAERRPPLAVLDVLDRLRDGPLDGLRLAALHGRLPPEDKDAVMRAFATGDLDVLVATTVIEVGVNVPNATVMVVLDADRFGVSQLHQLRGRVGRGSAAGLCLLVTELPGASAARHRLEAVAATTDGFELSRVDLEQRREGDVLGRAQSGTRSSLRQLSVLRDEEVIVEARAAARDLVAADRDLDGAPGLRAALGSLLDDDHARYLSRG